MAYSFNWNPDGTISDKDMLSYLAEKTVEQTDSKFTIKFASDDGGRHICIYYEASEDESAWSEEEFNSTDFKGWRVLRVRCPIGYIDTFIKINK